jgi:hypothetical protein
MSYASAKLAIDVHNEQLEEEKLYQDWIKESQAWESNVKKMGLFGGLAGAFLGWATPWFSPAVGLLGGTMLGGGGAYLATRDEMPENLKFGGKFHTQGEREVEELIADWRRDWRSGTGIGTMAGKALTDAYKMGGLGAPSGTWFGGMFDKTKAAVSAAGAIDTGSSLSAANLPQPSLWERFKGFGQKMEEWQRQGGLNPNYQPIPGQMFAPGPSPISYMTDVVPGPSTAIPGAIGGPVDPWYGLDVDPTYGPLPEGVSEELPEVYDPMGVSEEFPTIEPLGISEIDAGVRDPFASYRDEYIGSLDPQGDVYQEMIQDWPLEQKLGFDMDSFMELSPSDRLDHAFKAGVSQDELFDAGLLEDADTMPDLDYEGDVEDMARDFDYLRENPDMIGTGTPEQVSAMYEAAEELGVSMDDYYRMIVEGDKQYIDYFQQMDWQMSRRNQPYREYDYYGYGQPGYEDISEGVD